MQSYNYSELIDELESDIAEGLIQPDETIRIVRAGRAAFGVYYPIVDYYYCTDDPTERTECARAYDVLQEMIGMNKIL